MKYDDAKTLRYDLSGQLPLRPVALRQVGWLAE